MEDPTPGAPSRKGKGNNQLAFEGSLGQAGSQEESLPPSLAAEPKAQKGTRGGGAYLDLGTAEPGIPDSIAPEPDFQPPHLKPVRAAYSSE